MASDLPTLTVLQQYQVSPPPATVSNTSLPLTFFDIIHLLQPPNHRILFYEVPHTKKEFVETIVPSLKHSLSITLEHFFPYMGNLIVFSDCTKNPEIRYFQGDSVEFTSAECNLDFKDLIGNHPRKCSNLYHLIPPLGQYSKVSSDYIKIPVFSVQITSFSDLGFSIGTTTHHCLGDASTQFNFLKAWTSIARCGTDKSFVANNASLPLYERVIKYPKLDERFLKLAKVETLFNKEYQPPTLASPTDKLRAKFVLKRTIIDQMKKWVMTQQPTLPYVSSLTVVCAYIWCCVAKSLKDELEVFALPIDCRTRMDRPIPAAYFGNCVIASLTIAKTTLLTGDDGFITAARMLGENLHKMLTDKDGIVAHRIRMDDNNLFSAVMPTSIITIAGSPKFKIYDLDFGWGKPEKQESIPPYGSIYTPISIETCKESDEDLEIGVSLLTTEMQAFACIFNQGLQLYV